MYIIDPNSKHRLQVTNLNESIIQAEEFVSYPAISEFEKKQRTYWTSILNQLRKLKPSN